MNTLDKKYQQLLSDIIEFGVEKKDRTGTGTISEFGHQIRHKMSEGFPILTTKKVAWKQVTSELLWFLTGQTNITFLHKHNNHIWDGDAYKNYLHKVIRDKDIVRYLKSYSVDTNGVPTIEPYSKNEFIDRIKNDDEFAKKWGELGPIYGKQWRKWTKKKMYLSTDGSYENIYDEADQTVIDQISGLINELKTNPDSRRLMVLAWNVGELDQMVIPPCHYGFQVYTRELTDEERIKLFIKLHNPKGYEGEKITNSVQELLIMNNIPKRSISLMWSQRSCDFPLGIPANIMSYAILLMMLAKQVNMIPEELMGNFGDCHIYLNQIDGVKEQVNREPYPLPSVKFLDKVVNDLSEYTYQDIILENYKSHPKIYFPLSN